MDTATLFLKWRTAQKPELTQEEAAVKIGVKQPTYHRYETGKSKPRLGLLDHIVSVTGISRSKLRPDVFGRRP